MTLMITARQVAGLFGKKADALPCPKRFRSGRSLRRAPCIFILTSYYEHHILRPQKIGDVWVTLGSFYLFASYINLLDYFGVANDRYFLCAGSFKRTWGLLLRE